MTKKKRAKRNSRRCGRSLNAVPFDFFIIRRDKYAPMMI